MVKLQLYNFVFKFQVGTESSPFQHNAIIEMHGHVRSKGLPVYGAKTLALREGILDLHGLRIVHIIIV